LALNAIGILNKLYKTSISIFISTLILVLPNAN